MGRNNQHCLEIIVCNYLNKDLTAAQSLPRSPLLFRAPRPPVYFCNPDLPPHSFSSNLSKTRGNNIGRGYLQISLTSLYILKYCENKQGNQRSTGKSP